MGFAIGSGRFSLGAVCALAKGLGDICGLVKPPKAPNDPDSLFEKLPLRLCVAEDLLETVDCDHRFKLPTPSLTPCALSGRLYTALDRLRASGERVRTDSLVGARLASLGLCGLNADPLGRAPFCGDTEAARCTVMMDEEEAEFD